MLSSLFQFVSESHWAGLHYTQEIASAMAWGHGGWPVHLQSMDSVWIPCFPVLAISVDAQEPGLQAPSLIDLIPCTIRVYNTKAVHVSPDRHLVHEILSPCQSPYRLHGYNTTWVYFPTAASV